MERWLTKPRVMTVLVGALLSAALNGSEPLVWGLFLFMLCLTLLGFALPWASLRRIAVQVTGAGEVVENEASSLMVVVVQRGWWPVFMVDVQTRWSWAGQEFVVRQVVPVLRRNRPVDLGKRMRFMCRGHYRLNEVRLGSGFPLGLFEARLNAGGMAAAFVVLPKPTPTVAPSDLPISPDDRGMYVTRRLGLSQELGSLRDLAAGEPVRRVHWRASARAGRLIVQQYLQSGSPLLRVVVKVPDADCIGRGQSADEHAVRAAAGLCRSALGEGLRVQAYVGAGAQPVVRIDEIERALAVAEPGSLPLRHALMRANDDMREGDLLVVVVPESITPSVLLSALQNIASGRVHLQVLVARAPARSDLSGEGIVSTALRASGFSLWPSLR